MLAASACETALSGGRRSAPAFGFMGGIQRFNGVGGYGKSLKDDYRCF